MTQAGWQGWVLFAALAAAGAGCVTAKQSQQVQFDPDVIVGDPALEKLNDEELFATGTARMAAKEYADAARYFDRIWESFPQSAHRSQALLEAGRAYLSLEK